MYLRTIPRFVILELNVNRILAYVVIIVCLCNMPFCSPYVLLTGFLIEGFVQVRLLLHRDQNS